MSTTPIVGLTPSDITIDGAFGDWDAISDPDNFISDPWGDNANDPTDLNRDIIQGAASWDLSNLYLQFRRSSTAGVASLIYVAYIDVDADGYMETTDRVVIYSFSGNSPTTAECYTFKPKAPATSEALTGDNFQLNGGAGTLISSNLGTPSHLADATNIRCEGVVPWTALGLTGPAAVKIKFGCGRAINNVGDNTNVMHLLRRGVSLTADTATTGVKGTEVVIPHTITNEGNAFDTFSLTTTPTAWTARITTSPAGPDASSITLAPDASATIYFHATPPIDTPDGTRKSFTIQASCATSSTIRARVTDEVYVGALLVIPDNQGAMAPGETISYSTSIRNNSSSPETVSISLEGDEGWDAQLYDGASVVTQTVIPGSTTMPLTLKVSVPASAAIGTQERTILRATLASSTAVFSQSLNFTTARPALEVTPDRDSYGGDGTYVFLRHTVRNSWPVSRTVTLSASTPNSWATSLLAANGVTPIGSIAVGANGGTAEFVVRVLIPSGTPAGQTETATVQVGASPHSDTATDIIRVTRLATYDSSGFTNQTDQFKLGSTVYGRAMGLVPGSTVDLRWRTPAGAVVATDTRLADAQGTAWSSYVPIGEASVGTWALESVIGSVVTTATFTVTYDAAISDQWATDIPTVGGNSEIGVSLHKGGTVDLPPSQVDYLVWWDTNLDSTFNSGDLYITTASVTATYTGGTVPVSYRSLVGTMNAGTDYAETWLLNNIAFTRGGTWQVAMGWSTRSGFTLDTATDSFYSAMSALNMTISAGTIGFGTVMPEDTGTVPITVAINSTKTFSLSTSFINQSALGVSNTLTPQNDVLPGNYVYNDNISVLIPWGPAGLTTSEVVYTVVVE